MTNEIDQDSKALTARKARRGLPSWLKTLLAVVISVAILSFYFKDIDWDKFMEATREANLLMAFFAIMIPQLFFWMFTVYQFERTFTWFHKPFDWVNYAWVRGALYLVMMVNTGVGGVGNVLYLQQKTQISWSKFIAINFFRGCVQLASIGMVLIPLTIMMHVLGIFEVTPLNPWIWWAILIAGQLTFWDGWFFFLKNRTVGLSRYFFTEGERNGQLIGGLRNRQHELWRTFREARQKQWILLMVWAHLPVIAMIIGYWYFTKAFNVEIPFVMFAVTILLVNAIQDIPIAFAGFGSTTMAWSLFYGDYASVEAIASLTLCLPLLRLIARGMIGFVCMRPAISDVTKIIEDYRSGVHRRASYISSSSRQD